MGNTGDLMQLALEALKDKYGDDFQFEEGDKFLFSLKDDGALILSHDGQTLHVEVLLEPVIPLDTEFDWEADADE